ncbi:DUF6054 family protein [Paenibacillus wynnii]|uniref:Uncharacterized protein n=1 Tax=Paenibacillus wynnii TaxID=268407 RepID=A0A098M570_9BACL|nr:DUF6054 family protein [Paenibacillus wynnii]KGE17183.1 hypothetical protein PWYN_21340 [Paenibacillus wynnii]
MSVIHSFNLSLSPVEALSLVKAGLGENTELIHEELNNMGPDLSIGTLIYERYFHRSGNQAGLVIIIDNLQGVTNVRLISVGSSGSKYFKIDWGAGKSFASSVEKILFMYIID